MAPRDVSPRAWLGRALRHLAGLACSHTWPIHTCVGLLEVLAVYRCPLHAPLTMTLLLAVESVMQGGQWRGQRRGQQGEQLGSRGSDRGQPSPGQGRDGRRLGQQGLGQGSDRSTVLKEQQSEPLHVAAAVMQALAAWVESGEGGVGWWFTQFESGACPAAPHTSVNPARSAAPARLRSSSQAAAAGPRACGAVQSEYRKDAGGLTWHLWLKAMRMEEEEEEEEAGVGGGASTQRQPSAAAAAAPFAELPSTPHCHTGTPKQTLAGVAAASHQLPVCPGSQLLPASAPCGPKLGAKMLLAQLRRVASLGERHIGDRSAVSMLTAGMENSRQEAAGKPGSEVAREGRSAAGGLGPGSVGASGMHEATGQRGASPVGVLSGLEHAGTAGVVSPGNTVEAYNCLASACAQLETSLMTLLGVDKSE